MSDFKEEEEEGILILVKEDKNSIAKTVVTSLITLAIFEGIKSIFK